MLLGAFAESRSPKKILDVGTGCGVLALMMAQRYPSAKITAIELDENSCIDARKNFQSSTWSNRLQLIIDDFFQDSLASNFDLIISNPPFHLENVNSINERLDAAKHWSKRNVESFYHK